VKVRNARGLRDGGGSSIGKMVGMFGLNAGGGIARSTGLKGCTGVPKAGDDEGMGLSFSRAAVAISCVWTIIKKDGLE